MDPNLDGSILTQVKQGCGIAEDYTEFDSEILMYINGAMSVLFQLGLGEDGKPDTPFIVHDKDDLWSDLLGDRKDLEFVISYVTLKTKMMFDPPSSSFVLDAWKDMIDQYECRVKYAMELPSLSEGTVKEETESA